MQLPLTEKLPAGGLAKVILGAVVQLEGTVVTAPVVAILSLQANGLVKLTVWGGTQSQSPAIMFGVQREDDCANAEEEHRNETAKAWVNRLGRIEVMRIMSTPESISACGNYGAFFHETRLLYTACVILVP